MARIATGQYIGPEPLGFETRYFYPNDAYGEEKLFHWAMSKSYPDKNRRYYENIPHHGLLEFGKSLYFFDKTKLSGSERTIPSSFGPESFALSKKYRPLFGGPDNGKWVTRDKNVQTELNHNYFFEQGNIGFIVSASYGDFQFSLAFFQDACERMWFAPHIDHVFVASHWNEAAM